MTLNHEKLNNRLKNITVILVGILLIEIGMSYAAQALSNKMTEYLNYGYEIHLTK